MHTNTYKQYKIEAKLKNTKLVYKNQWGFYTLRQQTIQKRN